MSGESDFSVRFWGVRGSIACPGRETLRYGGNTACVEVRCGSHVLVFDGGTGLRPLGEALVREVGALDTDLFLTHTHFDHICGIPFFSPAFDPSSRIVTWAGHLLPDDDICRVLKSMMASPLFPVPLEIFRARVEFRDFNAGEQLSPRAGITIRTAALDHPDGATGYRVDYAGRSFCYVTDTSHVPDHPNGEILDLIRDADFVVYDAMFTEEEFRERPTWGHSTWNEGVRLCDAAGARTLVLFHHDPGRNDDALDAIGEQLERARPGSLIAREGMVLCP